jgi:hypothetical protein
MTVGEMLQRMSSAEFAEWMAYHGLEPFGPRREDLRFGALLALTANVHRERGSRAFQPADFLGLDADTPKPDVNDKLRAFFAANEGRVFKPKLS